MLIMHSIKLFQLIKEIVNYIAVITKGKLLFMHKRDKQSVIISRDNYS